MVALLLLAGCREIPHPMPPLVIPAVKDIWLGGVDHRQDKYGELADRYRPLVPNDHQKLMALLTR